MIDHTDDHAEETPPRRRRRRRPNGRWTNPASPLQAARFELRRSGLDVVKAIRNLCPGHAGGPCKIDVSKLSDYETGNRRPGLDHIEAFARYYQKSPEDLGLIHWRDKAPSHPEAESVETPPANPTERPRANASSQEQLVLDWLRDSVVSLGAVVLRALAQCPVSLTAAEDSSQPAKGVHDSRNGEDDPPAATPVPH